MTLVIDAVGLAGPVSEEGRLWRSVLTLLPSRLAVPVVLLDRDGAELDVPGIRVVPFPAGGDRFFPGDSALLEQVCRHFGAGAFLSTGGSTPLETPSVAVITGGPVPGEARAASPAGAEAVLAVAHARRRLCLGEDLRRRLLDAMPALDPATVSAVSQDSLADRLAETVATVVRESEAGDYRAFYERWSALRRLQGEVDVTG
jgi:hypothetical protein